MQLGGKIRAEWSVVGRAARSGVFRASLRLRVPNPQNHASNSLSSFASPPVAAFVFLLAILPRNFCITGLGYVDPNASTLGNAELPFEIEKGDPSRHGNLAMAI
ncbi:hypothetical protein DL93DRAFT_6695 [Clavulina sp. PMI_390]|nr:hypothetical protein DL93DRAFT_6695 [Clavulina sp. PMI_390]